MTFCCGCGENKATDPPADGGGAQNAGHMDENAKIQSAVLTGELRKLTVEELQAQSPQAPASEIESKADALIETQLKKMQEMAPDFLVVTVRQEEDLKNGARGIDVSARVQSATKTFDEFGVELPKLTTKLLADYKAGTLSPVRQVLLVHLLHVSEMKLLQDLQ